MAPAQNQFRNYAAIISELQQLHDSEKKKLNQLFHDKGITFHKRFPSAKNIISP